MGLGKKILWGVVGLIILNMFMDFIITFIVGALDLKMSLFDVDFSGWINGAIAGLLNLILILFIGLMPGSDEK